MKKAARYDDDFDGPKMIDEFDSGWDRPENVFPVCLAALYRMLSRLIHEGGKRRVRIVVTVEEA